MKTQFTLQKQSQFITCIWNAHSRRSSLVLIGIALMVSRALACGQTCRENCVLTNTFLGADALVNATGGVANTATGYEALLSNTTRDDNTAAGWSALLSNTTGMYNTALGSDALYGNSTGIDNTATGALALVFNTIGNNNTAIGFEAMTGDQTNFNSTGSNNTAIGYGALYSYTTGSNNTATGYQALNGNTVGIHNVASGYQTPFSNTSGITNTAVGAFALENSLTGSGNIAIGFAAGSGVTSGSNNIDIANNGANESSTIRIGSTNQTTTYIAGIRGVPVAGGQPVAISASGQLGIRASSVRFKEAIKPMGTASETILSLQPVSFRYKKEVDQRGMSEFGLIAEEVAKVDPDLVTTDDQGRPFSVRYDEVNAMLLNEFIKEHKTVQQQAATIKRLQQQVEALSAGLQQVKAEVETTRVTQQVLTSSQ